MSTRVIVSVIMVLAVFSANAQIKAFEVNEDWIQKIKSAAPSKAEITPSKDHKVLVFDLITGFVHWDTPHINEVMKVL